MSWRGFVPWSVVSRMVHRRQWCLEDCGTPGDGAFGDSCAQEVLLFQETLVLQRWWNPGDSGTQEIVVSRRV